MDSLIEMIEEVHPGVSPRYNKNYIGLEYGGQARNFVAFIPRKSVVIAEFKIPRDEKLTTSLDEIGLDTLSYAGRAGRYRVRVRQSDLKNHRDTISDLIGRARDADPRS